MLSVVILNVVFSYCYAECYYAECRYAECHGAIFWPDTSKFCDDFVVNQPQIALAS
jgi:hypothetical protein